MTDERRRRAYDDVRIRHIKNGRPEALLHIRPGQMLRDAIDYLAQKKVGLALVVDAGGSLAGVISERDVIRAIYEHGGDALGMPIATFMIKDVFTCGADDRIVDVAKTMTERHFRHMPIVDEGYLAGMLSASDLVGYFASARERREPILPGVGIFDGTDEGA